MLSFCAFAQEGRYKRVEDAITHAESAIELWISSDVDSIPAGITACKNLESIRFDRIHPTFDIEQALTYISRLPKLKEVHFWYFNQAEPPQNLKQLNQVQHIEFYSSPGINLVKYAEQLELLHHLRALTLRGMHLTTLPVEMAQLKQLTSLNLDNNDQLDLPQTLKILSKMKLQELDLSSAKFDVIPKEIARLNSVKILTLELIQGDFNNRKSYRNLSKLKRLEVLNVQGNFFYAFDPGVAQLKQLKRIEVDGNCLTEDALIKLQEFLPTTEIQNQIPC